MRPTQRRQALECPQAHRFRAPPGGSLLAGQKLLQRADTRIQWEAVPQGIHLHQAGGHQAPNLQHRSSAQF